VLSAAHHGAASQGASSLKQIAQRPNTDHDNGRATGCHRAGFAVGAALDGRELARTSPTSNAQSIDSTALGSLNSPTRFGSAASRSKSYR
jgi:hypothetical protein